MREKILPHVKNRTQCMKADIFMTVFGYQVLIDITRSFFRSHRGSFSCPIERFTTLVIKAYNGIDERLKTLDIDAAREALIAMRDNETEPILPSLRVR